MVPMETLIKSGKARLDGDGAVLARLRSLLVSFKPDFEIMPGNPTAEIRLTELSASDSRSAAQKNPTVRSMVQ